MRIISYAKKYKNPVIMHIESTSPNVIGGRLIDEGKTAALVMGDGGLILLPVGGKLPATLDEAMDARGVEMKLGRSYLYNVIAAPAIKRNRSLTEQMWATALDPEDDYDAV